MLSLSKEDFYLRSACPAIRRNVACNICSLQIPCQTVVETGSPGEAICKAAERNGADFIVVGSRGLNAIRRTFLGSVSDYVAHHAHLPVSIVPEK